MLEEQAGEVGVEPLVPRDELVAEREAGHESALLQPEDGGETAGEEDSLDGREGDDTLGKAGVVGVDPLEGPVSLLLDGGDGFDRVEQSVLLSCIPTDKIRIMRGVISVLFCRLASSQIS